MSLSEMFMRNPDNTVLLSRPPAPTATLWQNRACASPMPRMPKPAWALRPTAWCPVRPSPRQALHAADKARPDPLRYLGNSAK